MSRALVLLAGMILLAGCAALGGDLPRTQWRVTAESVPYGVLVTWNVPATSGRTFAVRAEREGGGAPTYERAAPDGRAQLVPIAALGEGRWTFRLHVSDGPANATTLTASSVDVATSGQPVRPVRLSDLGLDAPLATPVLVQVPSWGADLDVHETALRETLEYLALETARVAFGNAFLVGSGSEVDLVRSVRRRVLDDRTFERLPLDLDARSLVVVDLRPAVGHAPATLSLRVFDIAFADYDRLTPWNRLGLVFEDYVAVDGLVADNGLSHSTPLLRGFRALYGEAGSDEHLRRYVDAVSGGVDVFRSTARQDVLGSVVGFVGRLPGEWRGVPNHGAVTEQILFARPLPASADGSASVPATTSGADASAASGGDAPTDAAPASAGDGASDATPVPSDGETHADDAQPPGSSSPGGARR